MVEIGTEHGEIHGNAVVSLSTCSVKLAMEHGVDIGDQNTETGINIFGIPRLFNQSSVLGRNTRGHIVDGIVDIIVDEGVVVQEDADLLEGKMRWSAKTIK